LLLTQLSRWRLRPSLPISTNPAMSIAVYSIWAQEIAVRHWNLIAPAQMKSAWFRAVLRHEVDYRDQIIPHDDVIARTWLAAAGAMGA